MGGSDGGRTFESTPHAQSTVGTHHEPSGANNGTSVGRHTTGLRGRRRPTGMHRSGTAGGLCAEPHSSAVMRIRSGTPPSSSVACADSFVRLIHRRRRREAGSEVRVRCTCMPRCPAPVETGVSPVPKLNPLARSTRDGVDREWPRLSHALSAYRAGCHWQRSAMPFATSRGRSDKKASGAWAGRGGRARGGITTASGTLQPPSSRSIRARSPVQICTRRRHTNAQRSFRKRANSASSGAKKRQVQGIGQAA